MDGLHAISRNTVNTHTPYQRGEKWAEHPSKNALNIRKYHPKRPQNMQNIKGGKQQ